MVATTLSCNAGRAVAIGLLSAGAAGMAAAPATAAPIKVPGSDVTIDVPGIENLPVEGRQLLPADVQSQLPPLPSGSTNAADALFNRPNSSVGQQIVDAARSKIGSPYVWGAVGPSAFDCSGLTTWAHRQLGISIPRTSQAQSGAGQRISRDQLLPGDVVAFYGGATHVGIYVGNGRVVHASTAGVPVQEASMDSMPFYSASRYY